MNAIEFLEQPRKLEKMIEYKAEERERWLTIATKTTAQMGGERVQSSGSQQKMADAVEKCVDLAKEAEEIQLQLIDALQYVIKVIEKLSATEYEVMYKIYVKYYTLQQVAETSDRTYGWAKGVRRRAIRKVQKILDERENKNERG